MTEVVINRQHGGFGISDEAARWLIENRDWDVTRFEDGSYADESAELVDVTAGPDGWDNHVGGRYEFTAVRHDSGIRTDEDLIDCVTELDEKADGDHASLKVVEVPDDVEWEIEEYDGMEWIAEDHRTWS